MAKALRFSFELKKYGKNAVFLGIEKSIRIFLSIIVVSRVSKFLEPDNYGILALLESVFSILFAIAALGIDPIITREFKLKQYDSKLIFCTTFYLKFFVSIFLFIVYLLFSFFFFEKPIFYYNLIIGFGLLFSSINVIEYYFQSRVELFNTSLIRSFAFIASSIIKLFLVYNSYPLIYFVCTILIEQIIIFSGFTLISFRNGFSLKYNYYSVEIANFILRPAKTLLIISLSIMIYSRIDQLMIKAMLGDFMLGNYSAAQKIVETSFILPTIIISVIYPKTIEKLKSSNMNYIKKTFKIIWVISTFIAIVLFCLSDFITNLIFGVKYELTSELIKVLSFSLIFYSIKMFFNQIIYVKNLEISLLKQTLTSILINIILNYWFIKHFGVIGAAYATIISLIFSTYVYDFFDKKLIKLIKLKFPF